MIEQDLTKIGCHGNWRRYKNNPILKDDWGETFDVTVIQVAAAIFSDITCITEEPIQRESGQRCRNPGRQDIRMIFL